MSLVQISPLDVVMTALKRPELGRHRDRTLLVRFYNPLDRLVHVTVQFDALLGECEAVQLQRLDEMLLQMLVCASPLLVAAKPHSIVTIAQRFARK